MNLYKNMSNVEILENLKKLQNDIERGLWMEYVEALKRELELIKQVIHNRRDNYQSEIIGIIKELQYYIEILYNEKCELIHT